MLTATTAVVAAGLAPVTATAAEPEVKMSFRFSLNTSTIRGQKLPVPEQVDVASKAGYQVIEPWLREIDEYVKNGGSLKDLAKRIRDGGLTVESSIGFAEWIVDDDERRKKGLEQAKRDMDTLQQIGGKRLAAPPIGAQQKDAAPVDLMTAAKRYRELLELGDKMDVVPQVELWGFSTNLKRLGETALVAIESGHPKACVLADVYHLYKGGSDFTGLKLLGGKALQIFHMNDYPNTPRADITDAHRVYPGDGVAPLKPMLRDLRSLGFQGVLSLELFNPEYWKLNALEVAKVGLEKMKAVVQASLE
jgi:sugar phosphate isomerase/epimerase